MIITVFKDLHKSKSIPHYLSIENVIERIKNGNSKDLIEKILAEPDKDKQDKLKQGLPCILFAGKFSERNAKSLVSHSGLSVIDFDKIPPERLDEVYANVIANPHVMLAFLSPRKGIKAVIRIPECDKDLHPRYFKGFNKKYQLEFFDESNSDVCRVCYESYDPNIYYNPDAIIFTELMPDSGYSVHEKVPLMPLTDENEIIERILGFWDKNWGFVQGQRNDNIFKLACFFCEYGVHIDTALGYTWNNIVFGDFSEAEMTKAIRSAYRTASPNIKYFEDLKRMKALQRDIKTPKEELKKKYNIDEDTYNAIKEEAQLDDFWYYTDDKKPKLKIDSLKFKWFLERNGFKKYFPENTDKPMFIFVESNKVTETSVEKIKDYVLNYLLQRGEREVWNFCSSFSNLFTEGYLLMLDTIELLMLNDTPDTSYLAFRNGILKVTKNEITLSDYIDVDGYVWKRQIIDRDFVSSDSLENDYKKFINNVSSGAPLPLETIIGYLMSTYKNKTNNKAIILNDEVISQNPEGGTGKGLFIQGLRQMRKVAILDGKTFDDKKSFPYQTVSSDTQILVFDDVIKNFNFENKFSLVTEGMTLERKNKDAIKLSVENSPKMVISTNYVIKGAGNSHDRRRLEVEFSQHYGKKLTPYDEFGRHLFDDWTKEEFLNFDNYMVNCLQTYLKMGIVPQTAKNLAMRKLMAETSNEFYEWIDDPEIVPRNVRNTKTEYFEKFIEEYTDFKKTLQKRTFHKWIVKYCDFKEYEFNEGSSMNVKWFMIQTKDGAETTEEKKSDIPF